MSTKKQVIRSTVNPLQLNTLFFAGNSRLTFRNQETGSHMTVHVKQLKDKVKKDEKGRRLGLPIFYLKVSLLGDQEQGYKFAGTIFQENLGIKLAYGIKLDSQLGKVTSFIMKALKNPEILREKNVGLFHEGRCCRCAMRLTDPESITRGLGGDCYSYTQKSIETESPI